MNTETKKNMLNKNKLNEALAELASWDFSLTIQKLQEPAYAGWTVERAKNAEIGYKRYLAITKALDGYQPVPNGDIDRFWHEHILDTKRYADDCQSFFGYFLHHYPYFGMRGEADNSNWLKAAEFSNNTWKEAFGENLYSTKQTEPDTINSKTTTSSDMATQIHITININGGEVTAAVVDESLAAMKCPQACPNPGTGLAADAMKCPQACPNPGIDVAADAMKCPQACPNPG